MLTKPGRTPVIVTGLLATLLLGACQSKAGPGATDNVTGPLTLAQRPAVPGSPPHLDTTSGHALPIEAYQVRAQAEATMAKADRILIAQCMARFGFADPYAGLPEPYVNTDPIDRRYGVTDAAMAARWGYHVPPDWKDGASAHLEKQLSSAELLVLTGTPGGGPPNPKAPAPTIAQNGMGIPAGGCSGESSRKITPDGDFGDADIVRRIDGNSQADDDPAVVKVIAAWAACMKTHGYARHNPVSDLDNRVMGQEPDQAEIAEATADVQCKQQTNLVGVWFSTESAYESALIQQHIVELSAIKQKNDQLVRTAAAIVAAG